MNELPHVRRARLALSLACALACPLFACGLDGLTGGLTARLAGAQTDAAAPLDATALDASDAAMSSPDAAPDGSFCSSQIAHTVCSDFDEGLLTFDYSNRGAQWQAQGNPSLDTAEFSSAPASMKCVYAADAGTSDLSFGLSPTISQAHFELDARVEYATPFTTAKASFLNLFDVQTGSHYGLSVVIASGGTFSLSETALLADGGEAETSHLLGAITSGAWTHFSINETRGVSGHVTVAIDGSTVFDEDVTTLSAGTSAIELHLGLLADAPSDPIELHLDNFTADVQ